MEALKMALRVSPDTNYGVEELYAVGDRVIARLIATGTHEGDLPGFPASGNKFEYSAIVIARIENGKIIEEKIEFDELGFMQQLGMELRPKEGEK
jgi:predicted ester cyclase